MTFSRRARYALALGWLLAPLAGAAAGDLGPTSRGAVSISITVPAHMRVGPPAGPGPSNPHALCLVGAGLGDYRVRLLDSAGSPLGGDLVPGGPSGCAAAAIAKAAAARAEAGPVTLLIVPD